MADIDARHAWRGGVLFVLAVAAAACAADESPSAAPAEATTTTSRASGDDDAGGGGADAELCQELDDYVTWSLQALDDVENVDNVAFSAEATARLQLMYDLAPEPVDDAVGAFLKFSAATDPAEKAALAGELTGPATVLTTYAKDVCALDWAENNPFGGAG